MAGGGSPQETSQTTRVEVPDFIMDDLVNVLNQARANFERQQQYIRQRPTFQPEEQLARNYLFQRVLPNMENLTAGVGSGFDALMDPFGLPGALEGPIDIAGGALAPFNFRPRQRPRSGGRR